MDETNEQYHPDNDTGTLFEDNTDTSNENLKAIFEAILFVSKRPVTIKDLRKLCPKGVKIRESEIASIIEELKIEYIQNRRSFRVLEIADGYQMRTLPEFAPYIAEYFQLNKTESLSHPALETLAVIAYRQPITKAVIEGVRGVDSGGVIKSLYEKGLVKIVGRMEIPGRPFIYTTTGKFLEHFGLRNVEDLPHHEELRAANQQEQQEVLDFNPQSEENETGSGDPSPVEKELIEEDDNDEKENSKDQEPGDQPPTGSAER